MPKAAATTDTLQFADCSYDRGARRLTRAGRPLDLEPKMFELLDVLIDRSPSVVANEELDELLWPKVFVGRSSLARLVSELRSLLGDDPKESRLIRTVYKRGYAFCGELRRVGGAAAWGAPAAALAAHVQLLWRAEVLPLADGEHILGRGDECTLVIDAQTVSRRHARLTIRPDVILIEDLGSKNGTHVDGTEIRGATSLRDGARIHLGSESLVIRQRDAAAPTVAGRPPGTRE